MEPAEKRQKLPDYTYTPLAELGEGIFNVYGVISYFTQPRKCLKGTEDYIMTLTIIDPSCTTGIGLNIFASSEDKLPKVLRVGDIFRAHRLRVSFFQGRKQGVGGGGGFAFLVVDSISTDCWSNTKNYTFAQQDYDRIIALKIWASGLPTLTTPPPSQVNQPSTVNIKPIEFTNTKTLTIEQIEPNCLFDLYAQVIRISSVEGQGESKRISLSVWDGTGTKASLQPHQKQLFLSDYNRNPIPCYSPNSPFGSLQNVVVWNDNLFAFLEGKIVEGSWVCFKNVFSKLYDGTIECKVGRSSKLQLLTMDDPIVRSRLKDYQEKCSNYISNERAEQEKRKEIVSATTHVDQPYSTISSILEYPQPVYKFRCKARIIGHSPTHPKDFTKPFCNKCNKCVNVQVQPGFKVECPICQNEILEFVWMCQFKIEDETGSMWVILFKEDGENFFTGLPPVNLYENNISLDILWKKLRQLRDPTVWIDCCIKSYYINNDQSQRKYRIFDTSLTS